MVALPAMMSSLTVTRSLLTVIGAVVTAAVVILYIPSKDTPRAYTYVGSDYPQTWNIHMDRVLKTTEDSIHYESHTELGHAEWNSTVPSGGGMLYLGPQHRPFSISMFHQLRCLNIIGREILDERVGMPSNLWVEPSALSRHCMSYLRQMILCRSDTWIESAYNIVGPRIVISATTHTCNDWSAVYAAAEDNFITYTAKRE